MENWELALAIGVFATILGVCLVTFKEELKQLLRNAAQFKFRADFGGGGIELEILQKAQRQMKNAGVLSSGKTGYVTLERSKVELADLPARDRVIESWGSLKQIIYDAAVAQGIQMTPATRIPDALHRLVSAQLMENPAADAVNVLYEEGKKVAIHPGEKVRRDYAFYYQELVYSFIDWMMTDVIKARPIEPPPPASEPRRQTSVGGYFSPPGQGQPAAILIGVGGALKGKQFPLEKNIVRIGADLDNDIVIKGDDYASGKHAHIRYEDGSLLLADQHSRNGTFLNENRLTNISMTVNPGDRIRIGNSTLEVVPAPGR